MSNVALDKEYPLYIPENFDIDKLVQENPPTFPYHRDYFIYIVHLITDIPSRNKRDDDTPFVSLHSSLLQRRVRKYNLYLKYLVENKVLVCDNQYIKIKKSKGYKFYNNYETEIIETSITKTTLIKSIKQYIHIDYSQEDNQEGETINDSSDLNNLSKCFNDKLTVDFLSAKQYLRELREIEQNIFSDEFSPNAMRRYNSRLIPLIKLNTQNFAHTIDSTAGRMHTACRIITERRPDIPLFTLHDAIITTSGNEDFVEYVLSNVLNDAIGFPPTLKIEPWIR